MLGGLLAEFIFLHEKKKKLWRGEGAEGWRQGRKRQWSLWLLPKPCSAPQAATACPDALGAPGSPGQGTGTQAGSAVAPPTPWSPSQGAVRKEPNIPGAPAASPVGLAGRGRAVSPRAALPPRANLTLTGVRCQGRGHGPTAEKAHRDTEDAGPARLARSSTPGLLPGKPTSLCRAGPQRDKQNRISAFTGKT